MIRLTLMPLMAAPALALALESAPVRSSPAVTACLREHCRDGVRLHVFHPAAPGEPPPPRMPAKAAVLAQPGAGS